MKQVSAQPLPPYGKIEERINWFSHAIGFVLSSVALWFMVSLTTENSNINALISALIFGVSMMLVFLSSSLYHAISNPTLKQQLKLWDHCVIYLLIAGTYTPFLALNFAGEVGHYLLITVWLLAVFGIAFKLFFQHKHPKVSLATYLIMGWLALIALPNMIDTLASQAIWLLGFGGIAYSIGAIFYALKSVPFHHAIWHGFVLVGCACHFFSIYFYVLEN